MGKSYFQQANDLVAGGDNDNTMPLAHKPCEQFFSGRLYAPLSFFVNRNKNPEVHIT